MCCEEIQGGPWLAHLPPALVGSDLLASFARYALSERLVSRLDGSIHAHPFRLYLRPGQRPLQGVQGAAAGGLPDLPIGECLSQQVGAGSEEPLLVLLRPKLGTARLGVPRGWQGKHHHEGEELHLIGSPSLPTFVNRRKKVKQPRSCFQGIYLTLPSEVRDV